MAKAGQGQTLNDRLNAARYALAGQGLARVVCKATTEEIIGPKKKHLDYLLQCTHEPNVSIPQLANLLIERTSHSSWVVVFKALITVHHLMCYGNERFTQYLASSNCTFQLNNFLDRSNLKGYDMSTYIKRYSKYINEKALSYRTVAFDFAKIKRGKEDGFLRTMPSEKLLKTLAVLQSQIDALLEFDCPANHLTNGVINAAFMLLFRDLIRLFACYNDGIINLLEKFFDMNKKQCRDALEIYKKFLIRMDRVAEFLKVAENVGIDKGEIPDLTKAPSSLLEALEQHLQASEGVKKGKSSKDAQPTTQAGNSSAASITTDAEPPTEGVKDELVKKALEEEAQMLNQLKTSVQFQEKHDQQSKKPYNPFLSSPTEPTKPETTSFPSKSSNDILDLFGSNETTSTNTVAAAAASRASDDLLMLANNSTSLNSAAAAAPNPFADMLSSGTIPVTSTVPSSFNGVSSASKDSMGFDANFAAVFGQTTNANTPSGDKKPMGPPTPVVASSKETSEKADVDEATNHQTPNRRKEIELEPVAPAPTPAAATPVAEAAATAVKNQPFSTKNIRIEISRKTSGSRENLSIPLDHQGNRSSTTPSPTIDTLHGAGSTPILNTPPISAFLDAMDEGEKSGARNNQEEPFSSPQITAPPPLSSENSPFESPFNPPVVSSTSDSKSQVQNTSANCKHPRRPPPPSQSNVEPEKNCQKEENSSKSDENTVELHGNKDLFGFDSVFTGEPENEPQPASGSESMVPGMIPLVPVVPPTIPLPPSMDLSQLNFQQLAYIEAVRQQQAAAAAAAAVASATGAVTSAVVSKDTNKKKSAFEDLDFAMRSQMMKGKDDPAGKAASPVLATGGVSVGVPVPGVIYQGVIPGLPPGMAYPTNYLINPGVVLPQNVATGFDAFGDILQPQKSNSSVSGSTSTTTSTPSVTSVTTPTSGGLIKGDLDSSLASLAQNLDINGPKGAGFKKPGQQQFVNPKNTAKTGGTSWTGPGTMPTTVQPGMSTVWTSGMPVAVNASMAPNMVPTGAPWMTAQGVPMAGVAPIGAPGVVPASSFVVRWPYTQPTATANNFDFSS